MTTEFRLPQFGMGMTDGTILVWHKAEGEAIIEGEPLLEVEAAKTNVEIAAPVSGVLERIVIEAGTNVPVQTVIAVIGAGGGAAAKPAATEPVPAAADPVPAASAAKPLATPLARRVAAANGVDIDTVEGRGPAGKVMRADVEAAATAVTSARGASPGAKLQIEPRARRAAKELGIDLTEVAGSGKYGRIVEADVRNFRNAPAPVSAAAPVPAGVDGAAPWEDVPLSKMRRVIAERLTVSKQTVPHFYLVAHCEVDALAAARRQINETFPEAKVSLNDLVVRAIALAMMRVPDANVSWQGAALRRFAAVDVAVAVATDGGLITPIVRGVEAKPVRTIAAEVKDLAARARAGQLAPGEYNGGTVAVSNLGMYGVEEFTAIINPPHACIFAIGAASERPVVRNGVLAVANVMTCTLSVDHRAVDGAVAAQLLHAFKTIIERPAALLA